MPAFRFLRQLDDLLAVTRLDLRGIVIAIDLEQPRLDRVGHRTRLGIEVGVTPILQRPPDLMA